MSAYIAPVKIVHDVSKETRATGERVEQREYIFQMQVVYLSRRTVYVVLWRPSAGCLPKQTNFY